jgi:hypothetical protein
MYRVEVSSKIEAACPKCGKPLLTQRDKHGIAVKAFDLPERPKRSKTPVRNTG